MTKKTDKNTEHSDLKNAHNEMLKEALSRPGIREIMEIFYDWKDCDRKLDTYRAATRQSKHITTNDHTNVR